MNATEIPGLFLRGTRTLNSEELEYFLISSQIRVTNYLRLEVKPFHIFKTSLAKQRRLK